MKDLRDPVQYEEFEKDVLDSVTWVIDDILDRHDTKVPVSFGVATGMLAGIAMACQAAGAYRLAADVDFINGWMYHRTRKEMPKQAA